MARASAMKGEETKFCAHEPLWSSFEVLCTRTLDNLRYLPGQTQLHPNPIGFYPNLYPTCLPLSLPLLQNSCLQKYETPTFFFFIFFPHHLFLELLIIESFNIDKPKRLWIRSVLSMKLFSLRYRLGSENSLRCRTARLESVPTCSEC